MYVFDFTNHVCTYVLTYVYNFWEFNNNILTDIFISSVGSTGNYNLLRTMGVLLNLTFLHLQMTNEAMIARDRALTKRHQKTFFSWANKPRSAARSKSLLYRYNILNLSTLSHRKEEVRELVDN